MKATTNKYALITGASSGIGKSLAEEYARRKSNLVLVALAGTGLQQLSRELSEKHGVDIRWYEADLTGPDEPIRLHDWVTKQELEINLLINNAGIGYQDHFENLSTEFCEKLMRLNMQVVVLMTLLFIPELKKCESPKILNVSSLASFAPMPYKSMYAASKAFVYSFSRAIHHELKASGIKVSVLCPGPVPTNVQVRHRMSCHSWFSKITRLLPGQVAMQCINSLDNNSEIIIPGMMNKIVSLFMRMIPNEVQLQLITRRFNQK